MAKLKQTYGGMGIEKVAIPAIPPYLAVYMELRQWQTTLVSGGILDQPAWSWDLVTLAGRVYEAEMSNQDVVEVEGGLE